MKQLEMFFGGLSGNFDALFLLQTKFAGYNAATKHHFLSTKQTPQLSTSLM
jgi:hypothetical protein